MPPIEIKHVYIYIYIHHIDTTIQHIIQNTTYHIIDYNYKHHNIYIYMQYQFIYVYIIHIHVYIYIWYAGLSIPSHSSTTASTAVGNRHLSKRCPGSGTWRSSSAKLWDIQDMLWENHGKPSIQNMEELYPTYVGKPMVQEK